MHFSQVPSCMERLVTSIKGESALIMERGVLCSSQGTRLNTELWSLDFDRRVC